MQQGGGIGYDFSTLRPRGAPVKGVGADASGPLSFMDVWDAMCRTIMSAGSRRGAMMATLRCDHPDIEAFIAAKREPGRLRMFNLSVLVSDAFMAAVATDALGTALRRQGHRKVKARDLWDAIMRATYAYAEPGVIFIDRINAAEQPALLRDDRRDQSLRRAAAAALWRLPAGLDQPGLARRSTPSPEARLDEAAGDLVATAVRMMDNVIDVSRFPLPEHRRGPGQAPHRPGRHRPGRRADPVRRALRQRRGGRGLTESWMKRHPARTPISPRRSGPEKGAFPLFDRDAYLAGETVARPRRRRARRHRGTASATRC
jgi:ribonucleoside-diphosphate reductase alpha chain